MPDSGPFSSSSFSSSATSGEENNLVPSLEAQKSLVKATMKSALQEDAIWVLIATSWFRRWQKYVAFNDILDHHRSQEEIDSFFPGPIENNDILLNGTELKKNIFEGIDYILLPETTGKMLHEVYGGSDMITRKVVARNTHYSRNYYVELYPIKFRVFLEKEVSTSETPTPVQTHYLSSSLTVTEALLELYNSLQLRSENCRVWIRNEHDGDDDVAPVTNNNDDTATDVGSGRKLTSDVTDVDGCWRYLRNITSDTLQDFNMVSIDIMIEQKTVNSRTGQWYWPKDEVLNEWKQNLRRGDMIDAKDTSDTWCESVVSSVNIHSKTITIHFKGWGKNFDRDISMATQLATEIAPLYTRTENWRDKLRPFDRVDYTKHAHLDKGRKWFPAYVMTVDHAAGLLKLKVREDSSIISEVDGVDLYGESICKVSTHVKSVVPNFASYPVTGSRANSSSTATAIDYSANSVTSHHHHTTTTSYSSLSSTSLSSSSSYMTSHTSSSYGTGRYGSSWNSRSHATGTPVEVGVVGLYNLGNTCFMNSMLQCLSNTKILTDCFLNDSYASQINSQNPLGHGGKVATSYARLMKEMWCGKYVAVSPEDFKRTIGEFAPQFSGYQQQDSQELMLFLLDGLHEDLNRVVNKPFVEKIESKGRDDELISREAWRRFLLRNDSELVDKCFGQLRSHVTCTNCGYQSVTFDEYSSLSLPLPIKNTVEVEVIVYPLPVGTTPIKLTLDVDGLLSLKEFQNLVVSKLNLHPETKKRRTNGEISSTENVDANGDFVIINTDNNSSTQSTSTDSPDGYESDLADLGDKEDEDLGGPTVLVSNNGRKNPRHDHHMEQVKTGGFFHFCESSGAVTGNGSRIFKTFEDRTIVKELSRLRDPCLMIELQHDAPTTIHYTGAYSTNSQPIRYVDILMGTISKAKSYYTAYSTSTFDLNGPAHRFSYQSVGTTYGHIQELIWTVMKTYLHSDSPYQSFSPATSPASDSPYDIYLTNSYGSQAKGQVTWKYTDHFSVSAYEALICVWKDDALREEHFNLTAVEEVRDYSQIVAAAAASSASSSSSSSQQQQQHSKSGNVHVLDCLNKFIEREQMPPEETWYCPSCKQHLAPIKKFDVWTAPDILIIHLKRFQYVPGVYFVHREKLCDLIEFPITGLDLTSYVKSASATNDAAPPIYDLYGVSEHIGGMGGGHYTATAMNPINRKWYNFNDSSAHEVNAEDAISTKAYVLFYKRREGSLKWAGAIPLPEPLTD